MMQEKREREREREREIDIDLVLTQFTVQYNQVVDAIRLNCL